MFVSIRVGFTFADQCWSIRINLLVKLYSWTESLYKNMDIRKSIFNRRRNWFLKINQGTRKLITIHGDVRSIRKRTRNIKWGANLIFTLGNVFLTFFFIIQLSESTYLLYYPSIVTILNITTNSICFHLCHSFFRSY